MDELLAKIRELMKEHGVETYHSIIADPDTLSTWTTWDGNKVWVLGALTAEQAAHSSMWVAEQFKTDEE